MPDSLYVAVSPLDRPEMSGSQVLTYGRTYSSNSRRITSRTESRKVEHGIRLSIGYPWGLASPEQGCAG